VNQADARGEPALVQSGGNPPTAFHAGGEA
jgi:hypothetical protein